MCRSIYRRCFIVNWLHFYYILLILLFLNLDFILDYYFKLLFNHFITPYWILNFFFNYFLFSLLFFSGVLIYRLNIWCFVMVGSYICWYDCVYLIDTNRLILINELLVNSLHAIHPPLTYTGIIYTFFYFIYMWLSYSCYHNVILYTYRFYYYLIFVWWTQLFNFVISMWWALQEGTWGGWWGWDISEIFIIIIIVIILLLKHVRIYYSWLVGSFIWLFRTLAIILVFYKLFRIYFIWNLHTFFLVMNETLWAYNSYYTSALILLYILVILNRNYGYYRAWDVTTQIGSLLYVYLLLYLGHLFFDLSWLQFYNLNFYFLYWCWVFLTESGLVYSLLFHLWILSFYICIGCNYFQSSVHIYISYSLILYLLNELTNYSFTLLISSKLISEMTLLKFYFESNALGFEFNTIYSQYFVLLDLKPTLLIMLFSENLNFIYMLVFFSVVYSLDFLYYYNWLRFAILTPSHFSKNRLLIERTFHNRLIYSFFGSTYKSFIWSQLSSTVVNSYIWKNFYYYFILIVLLVMLLIIIRWNLLVFNFPIKYWFVYIWWRMFDGFYFFFLQIQYLMVLCILSSSWYVLNTYFNIQLNLLYLIIFNFFNTTLDIQHTTSHIDNFNTLYRLALSNLFRQNLKIDFDLVFVPYYFYRSIFCLNMFESSSLFRKSDIFHSPLWTNFIILRDRSYNDRYSSPYSLLNQVPFTWFKSLNFNPMWNYTYSDNHSIFIQNWYNALRVLRWDSLSLNSYYGSTVDVKSIIGNFYFNNNAGLGLIGWIPSLEWFLFRCSLSPLLRRLQPQLSYTSQSVVFQDFDNKSLETVYDWLNCMIIFNNYILIPSDNTSNAWIGNNCFYYIARSFLNLSSFFSYKTLYCYSSWLATNELRLPLCLFDTLYGVDYLSKDTSLRSFGFLYYF